MGLFGKTGSNLMQRGRKVRCQHQSWQVSAEVSAGRLTKGVRRCGSQVPEPQGFLQYFQVTFHTAVLLDVTDILS